MRRLLVCGLLLGWLVMCLPGCGAKEPGGKKEELPAYRIPQDPKTKKI
jgi:hypothetical protein